MGTERENKLDYISNTLDKQIKSFKSSAIWYRRVNFYTSISTLVLSGMITILAGWKQDQPFFKTENIILVLSALITIVSGWGFFFSPKNSWLIFASSLNRLRALKSRIEFMKALPSASEDDEKTTSDLYAELQAIFDAHNKAWLDIRSTSAPMPEQRPERGAAHAQAS